MCRSNQARKCFMAELKIRRLTPDLAEDYARFFDMTPHNLNTDGGKCYCVTWRGDDSYEGSGGHWFPTPEERRARAVQFVKSGSLQGYLAYCGEKVVGWCNANGNCRRCVEYLRSFWPIEEYRGDVRIKSVFCFVIAPEMQRKGVATRLLQRVCKDAADDGFDYAEAYAHRNFRGTDDEFRGPPALYEKCGFTAVAERDGRVVMRKALK